MNRTAGTGPNEKLFVAMLNIPPGVRATVEQVAAVPWVEARSITREDDWIHIVYPGSVRVSYRPARDHEVCVLTHLGTAPPVPRPAFAPWTR